MGIITTLDGTVCILFSPVGRSFFPSSPCSRFGRYLCEVKAGRTSKQNSGVKAGWYPFPAGRRDIFGSGSGPVSGHFARWSRVYLGASGCIYGSGGIVVEPSNLNQSRSGVDYIFLTLYRDCRPSRRHQSRVYSAKSTESCDQLCLAQLQKL